MLTGYGTYELSARFRALLLHLGLMQDAPEFAQTQIVLHAVIQEWSHFNMKLFIEFYCCFVSNRIQAQNRVPSMGSIAMMPDGQAMMMTANTPSAYTDDQSYSHNFDSHASDNSIEKMPLDPDGAGVVPMPVRPSSRKTKKQEALGDAAADDDREYGAEGDDGQRRKHRHRRQDGDGDDDPNKPKRKSKKRADGEGQLRIDIKAQPGTSVHIAPGTNYPPAANATISSETEI
jgi:hypothetical protein